MSTFIRIQSISCLIMERMKYSKKRILQTKLVYNKNGDREEIKAIKSLDKRNGQRGGNFVNFFKKVSNKSHKTKGLECCDKNHKINWQIKVELESTLFSKVIFLRRAIVLFPCFNN